MVREMHVSEEVDALMPLPKEYLRWVQVEVKIAQEKCSYEWECSFELGAVAREQYEVVSVAEVVFDPQLTLHVLVKTVEVDIGE